MKKEKEIKVMEKQNRTNKMTMGCCKGMCCYMCCCCVPEK